VRLGLSLRAVARGLVVLVRYGTASEDGVVTPAVCRIKGVEAERLGGERQDGESGELGDGDVDLDVTKRNAEALEGDRDSERLILNVEAAST